MEPPLLLINFVSHTYLEIAVKSYFVAFKILLILKLSWEENNNIQIFCIKLITYNKV